MGFSIFVMNLYPESFDSIKNGTKIIEMRLNDEKRSQLKIGDMIVFINSNNKEELKVEVIGLSVYKDFYELYDNYDKLSIGYLENEEANPIDMYSYYTKESIAKYGVLAIEIKLLY